MQNMFEMKFVILFVLKRFFNSQCIPGMMALTLTAAVSELHPPNCDAKKIEACVGASFSHVVYLLSSFMLLVIGAGSIRPCSLPFGLDQFNPATESGKRDIKSFFSWYYFTTTVCGDSFNVQCLYAI